jgi:hypothetical protein
MERMRERGRGKRESDLDYFWNKMKRYYNEMHIKIVRKKEIQQYIISINERNVQ